VRVTLRVIETSIWVLLRVSVTSNFSVFPDITGDLDEGSAFVDELGFTRRDHFAADNFAVQVHIASASRIDVAQVQQARTAIIFAAMWTWAKETNVSDWARELLTGDSEDHVVSVGPRVKLQSDPGIAPTTRSLGNWSWTGLFTRIQGRSAAAEWVQNIADIEEKSGLFV